MFRLIDLFVDEGIFGDSKDPFLYKEDDYSISELIPRILNERKSFLNLSEDGLKREISQGDTKSDIIDSEIIEEGEGENSTNENKNIKAELAKNINLAINETSLSLDLVSLLLSSTKPNLSKATISPFLSKTVPLGSLNTDRLNSDYKVEDSRMVGQGWKNESMSKVTSLLKEKAQLLHKQVAQDTKYWSMINQVLENEEILIKLKDPLTNSRAIGVKYGYSDSGSNYHNKGIAILRRTSDGSVNFTPVNEQNRANTFKYIRVRILGKSNNEFKVIGQSDLNLFTSNKEPLINNIEMARYFIFEEDLFYNLLREARTLISYNVSILSDKILLEINDEIIEIESVVHGTNIDGDGDNEQTQSDTNHKCNLILNYLKIMLCGYYKYNLNLKQKVPTSFTKFKQSNSHPLILRPLIGTFKHESSLARLIQSINNLLETHKNIESEVKVLKYENIKAKVTNPFLKSIEKPVSNIVITLKNSKGKYLKITVCLTSSEIFVNTIILLNIIRFESLEDLNGNENGINVLNLSFNELKGLEEGLHWSIQSFVS